MLKMNLNDDPLTPRQREKRRTGRVCLILLIITLLFAGGYIFMRQGTSVPSVQAQESAPAPKRTKRRHKRKRTHARKARYKCVCRNH